MATLIRAKISEKNKYWIDKHRHYELKHFCLQYPDWKRAYVNLDGFRGGSDNMQSRINRPSDPTGKAVELRNLYLERMDLVKRMAYEADQELGSYIFIAVTEGLSYTYLKTKLAIPCGRDMYYNRYRKFFWLLSQARD